MTRRKRPSPPAESKQAGRDSREFGDAWADGSQRQAPSSAVPQPLGPRDRLFAVALAAAVCALLVLAVLLVFGRSLGYGFVNFDDDVYVYQNPHLARGLTAEGMAWAMTTTRCDNWHPATWLSYLLDYQLNGLTPWGYHLTNVLLHAAAATVLFLVLRRMTGEMWPSAFVAAVFALHPLRVESVVWVAERKDVLCGLFFMLTLAAYVGYVRRPFSLARYMLVALLFAVGLMAKPMLVTLPLVLLLLDYWPLGRMAGGVAAQLPSQQATPQRTPWRLVVEKLPLLALSAASCVATSMAQRPAVARFDVLPLTSRIANALVSYAAYLGAFFHPAGLAVFYPHPRSSLPPAQIVGAVVLWVGVCIAVLVWRRSRPYLMAGWFWYVGMLVPVIGLVQVGAQSMADRYTYLPQIGLVIGLTWGAKQFFQAWPHRAWWPGVISALLLATLMGCTWQQMSYWHDSETLWRRALECAPGNVIAYNNLGIVLREQGRLDEAIAQHQQALEIKPNDVQAHVNLGAALYQQGRIDEALVYLQRAVAIKSDYAIGHNNLATALNALGRNDEAVVHYRRATEILPDYMDARNNLGVVLYQCGKTTEAIAQWRESLSIHADDTSALSHLATVLAAAPEPALRNGQEAVRLAERAANLTGGQDPVVLDALAAALAETGRFAEALETAEHALALASSRNDAALAETLRTRIKLYHLHSPYHDMQQSSILHSDHP
jgi:protein O-mannosyl-transferase